MSTFNKYRLKGAFHYDWYETEDWYKWIVDRAVNFCKGSTIDFGCGDGVVMSKIQEKGYSVVGFDNDSEAIGLAKERNLNVSQKNLDYPFGINIDPDFDYLCCVNTIEHLNDTSTLLDFVRRAKKGAIITTIDYQGGSLGEDHKFEWTYDEMMDFFKEFNPKGFRYKDTEWIGVEIKK